MRYVATAEEMRALDRITIDEIGLPGAVLMENAGRAVARVVAAEGGGRVAVVCGAGNNGGDGYVVARCLREQGWSPTVYLAAAREQIGGDAALHLRVYEQVGGLAVSIADASALAEHRDALAAADVVVDCIFGTGLAREVEGHYRAIIETIAGCAGQVIAVDVPSGLNADTGAVMGVAVRADHTVTIGFLKVALVGAPGFAHCGQVTVADIGIPRELAQARGVRAAASEHADVAALLPVIEPLAHKGRRGHLLVVAGSPGKRGAARLTSWAGLRIGAGLVTVATSDSDRLGAREEIMTAELSADEAGAARLIELAGGMKAIAMGPGMATGEGARRLIHAALERADAPLVLDADALNHLGGELERVAASRPPVVLTPHPGEAARLLGVSPADIEADRMQAVRQLAERSGAVVVLKGARSLICDGGTGDGFVTINPTGGPGLATAGAGDVLTGMIGGLLAQGMAPEAAARAGVYIHGLAGDLAADSLGARSVAAGEVTEYLSAALATLESPSMSL